MTWISRRGFNSAAMALAARQAAPSSPVSDPLGSLRVARKESAMIYPRQPSGIEYRHVDVFTREPLSGNGLIVFESRDPLSAEHMQALTREMRQFESIFLVPESDPRRIRARVFTARVFTVEEELDFAGHPVLGAAAVLHERYAAVADHTEWTIHLKRKSVPVTTTRSGSYYRADMDQGLASFGHTLSAGESIPFLRALNLGPEHIVPRYPLQQISTGLPYLIVPVVRGLDQAKILRPGFESLLDTVEAKFVYVFDLEHCEGRTWDNLGLVEDVATGSAAGPAGAYLVRHGIRPAGQEIILSQGRFAGRPSQLLVHVQHSDHGQLNVRVAGEVRPVASGRLD